MSGNSAKRLTFTAVDELAFAVTRGLINEQSAVLFEPRQLGPLLELISLTNAGLLPAQASGAWLVKNGAAAMLNAMNMRSEHWISPDNKRMGFIRAQRAGIDGDARLTGFLMDAQRAARDVAGLFGTVPGQMAAAMEELENNIHEHSESPATGLLAFRAASGVFEFVACDAGIGLLASLSRCSSYPGLSDHGAALELALTDGASRFGPDSNRGHGFRPIFIGLVNLRGSLRFRTGDHALTMDGTTPNLTSAQLAQKASIAGFFASVRCEKP